MSSAVICENVTANGTYKITSPFSGPGNLKVFGTLNGTATVQPCFFPNGTDQVNLQDGSGNDITLTKAASEPVEVEKGEVVGIVITGIQAGERVSAILSEKPSA